MSFPMKASFLAVGRLIAMELQRLPVKVAADALETSDVTIKKMRRGELPNAVTLLRAIENFGLRILEPVLGPSDNASLARRLDLILAEVGDLKNVVSPAVSQAAHNLLAEGAGDRGRSHGRPGAADGQVLPRLALVSTRKPLADLARQDHEPLRRHLSAKLVNLDEVKRIVASDNLGRTGLAYRRPGDDWTILPARENRLWSPSADPRRATEYVGNVADLRRDLNEAAAESAPLFIKHAGALQRDGEFMPFHSSVVRIGGRTDCGADVVLTDFLRCAA